MTQARAAMSFAGAVGFGVETVYGSAAPRTAWVYANTASPSIKRAEAPAALIASDWEALESVKGLLEVGVNIAMQAYAAAAVQILIDAAIARNAMSGGDPPGQPTSLTIELVMDNGKSIVIAGAVCNQLQVSVKPSDIVGLTFDFLAKTAASESSGSPSPSTGAIYHGANAALTIGATGNALVNSFDITIANNASRRNSFTADGTCRVVRAANQTVKGNMQADFETDDLLAAFLARNDQALTLTVTGADGSLMVISVPKARYEGDDPALSGANAIEDKLPFLAVKHPSSGYAVSVTMQADVTAPTCTILPIDNATGIPVDANLVATFSEPLRTSSVSTSSVVVVKANDGTNVAGVVTLVNSGASTTVAFNPDSNFDPGTAYIWILSTDICDLAGNHLAAHKIGNFTTAT